MFEKSDNQLLQRIRKKRGSLSSVFDKTEKEKNGMNEQDNTSFSKQSMNKTSVGVLTPTNLDATCAKCGQPIIAVGLNPYHKDSNDEYPLFCAKCEKWFHKRCGDKKGWYCPSCQKVLSSPDFFCKKCNANTTINVDSTWPHLSCTACSEPISLAIYESVGVSELAILAAGGAITIAAFIHTLVMDLPLVLKIIAGVFAVPLGLPLVAIVLGAILSEATSGFHNSNAPGTNGMQLQIAAARDFAGQPIAQRLRQVYFFYLKKSIAALLFCVAAIVFIYLWSLSKN